MAKPTLTRGDVQKFRKRDAAIAERHRKRQEDPEFQRQTAEVRARLSRPLTKVQKAWVAKTKRQMDQSRLEQSFERVNDTHVQVIGDDWLVQTRVEEVDGGPAIVGLTILSSSEFLEKLGRPAPPKKALTTRVLRQIDMRTPVNEYFTEAKQRLWFLHRMKEIAAPKPTGRRGRPTVHSVAWYQRLAKAVLDLPPGVEQKSLAAKFEMSENGLRSAIRRCRQDYGFLPKRPSTRN